MDKHKEEVDGFKEDKVFEYADQFINLANKISYSDRSGAVGVAFRYAAARYCAYEATLQTKNLAADKDKQLQLFLDAFAEMLRLNFEDYIEIESKK